MLDDAHGLIRAVGKKLGLSEADVEAIIKIDNEHIFDIELTNGKSFKAYRVQHKNIRGPYKGGIRFHPDVTLDEVRALATLMSLKTAAVGLPMGGGKGGVAVNPRELTEAELEEVSRKYAAGLHPHIGPDKDIPAPDVNTSSSVIDWMVDEYEKLTGDSTHASFTGKSLGKGGSEGREAATGRGGVIVLGESLKHDKINQKPVRIAVQGFGNVGSYFATVGHHDHPDWQLVAASDSSATLLSDDGLDATKLQHYKADRGKFKEYKEYKDKNVQVAGADAIFAARADVLVLAALEGSLNQSNMKQIKAKYILELANGPVAAEAHDYLVAHGKIIIPDIVANAGGVVVSYLEWVQNKSGEHWPESKVNSRLEKYLVKAVQAMYQTARHYDVPLKEAAFINGLRALAPKSLVEPLV